MRTELVGRERELAQLGEFLDEALDGHPRLVLCRGEPGIGKTRLAEELVWSARSRGVAGMWGLAVDAAGAPPYWPWRQVLRALGGVVDLAAVADEHRLASDLARLAPDVFAGPPADAGSAEDRFRIFDAVARLLRHVTASVPLVIVLDDAHWADPPSLLLLQHVVRSLTGERLLVVANHRDTEPLHGVLVTELPREPAARLLHLGGLTAPAVARQLASVVGSDMADAEAGRVHARTGGNPFFVGEIGRVLADRRAGVAASPVTVSVREAIGARMNRLSAESVRLLQAASIVGRDFSVAVVAPMVDSPVVSCLAPLDEAVAAGLVEVTPIAGELRFLHALVRDAIEAGLGTPERVRLHRSAAEAVEKLHAARLDPHLSDLARHWAVAAVEGDRARAVRWIERAAEEAMRRVAYEEGARLFRLALIVGAGELDELGHCRLLLAVGKALKLAGEYPGRLDACREAAALARRLGRPDLLAESALALEGVGYETDLAARRLCEEALAALDPGPSALRARVTARLSDVCMYLGDLDAAGVISGQALAVADECGDPGALVAALQARQLVCAGPDGRDERARLAEQIFLIGRETGDPETRMWAHLWRVDVALQRGDLSAVTREADLLAACVDEVGGTVARWQLLRIRTVLAQAQARFADGLRLVHEAYSEISATGHPAALIVRDGALFNLGVHIGHGPEGTGELAMSGYADAAASEQEVPIVGLILALGPAYLLARAGRLDEAAAISRRLGPPEGWVPMPHVVTVCYAYGLGTSVALGESDDVAALRDLLGRYRGHHLASGAGCVGYGGPVEIYLGTAAAHLGLLDEAATDLEEALKVCAANGAVGFQTEAQYELAAVLARRAGPGDLPRARLLVAEAARQAAALGMTPFVEQAGALAARLDAGPPTSLTPREREVADLVAQGLTNREIATRLYLSERTAQNHVQHILTKLGLPNRSGIAVWVTSRK